MSAVNATADNKKSAWTSIFGCFCIPIASSAKPEAHEPTLDDITMRRLNNEELTRELSKEVDEKAAESTVVCEEPKGQPRPLSAPEPKSLPSHPPTPSSTSTEEPAATMLRSKFSTRRAKPRAKTLDRLESAPIVKAAPIVEPVPLPAPPPPVEKRHHRRWSSATNVLDSSKTTIEIYLVEGSKSLPNSPARNAHEQAEAEPMPGTPFIKHQKNTSSITFAGGNNNNNNNRSRAHTVPGESVKKADTAVIKVALMTNTLPHEETAAPEPAAAESTTKKTHISNCFRPKPADTVLPHLDSPTLPAVQPSTPFLVPEFPLPPPLPAVLQPSANQRRSLSFVSQWLFDKTENSYPMERLSIPDSIVVKEIVSLCFSTQHFRSANASSTTLNTYKTCNADDNQESILSAWWVGPGMEEANDPHERRSYNVAGKVCSPLSSVVFTV